MKISLIIEGKTERAFLPVLQAFLKGHLAGRMPDIDGVPQDGRIPIGEKLKRMVKNLLTGRRASDHVIALTDVYTGTQPPDFWDATDAIVTRLEVASLHEPIASEPSISTSPDRSSCCLPSTAPALELCRFDSGARRSATSLCGSFNGSPVSAILNALHYKSKMRQWVGNEPRFHPHAAQYDFEAWLLPYWPTIQRLAGHNTTAPGNPETVNHNNPPAHRIKEIFEVGTCRNSYVKPRDALRILQDNNLLEAINQCTELKALVNTILSLSGGATIP